jgi:hypothetical protein
MVVLICVLIEGGSYAAIAYLSGSLTTRLLVYRPASISEAEYERYLTRRDPHLGWPPPEEFGGKRYDSSGSRRILDFPEPGGECVSAYGDSFTYGSDVSDAEAWPNVLSRQLGCHLKLRRGWIWTDQAYLRFESNVADQADYGSGIHPTDAIPI